MLFPCPALAPISAARRAASGGGASALLTGLVSYWKLDEVSGNRSDSVGGNTLTDVNTVTSVAGKVSNAAQFTAANSERLFHATNAALETGDIDFSAFGWFYLTSSGAGAGRTIVAKATEWEVTVGSTGVLTFKTGSGDTNFNGFATMSYDGWHSFYAEYRAGTTNGVQIDNGSFLTIPVTTPVSVGSQPFEIGSIFGGAGNFLDGRVDEVGFWKRLLTVAERTQLWNGGNGVTYPTF